MTLKVDSIGRIDILKIVNIDLKGEGAFHFLSINILHVRIDWE